MEKLLGVKEAAEFLGIHPKAVYRYVSSGKIPYIRFRYRGIRFSMADLKKWVNMNRHKPKGGSVYVYLKDNKGEREIDNQTNENERVVGGNP